MFTNINIMNNQSQFKYVVEYNEVNNIFNKDTRYLNGVTIDGEMIDDILFITDSTYMKHHNHWYSISQSSEVTDLPSKIKLGNIRLYFPNYSVDSYEIGHKYALTISTWICGKKIVLGTYIIDRVDSLACDGMRKFFNEDYYEYIELPIIDPLNLIYSDEWKNWRQNICGESDDVNIINSVGSLLHCDLHPVKEIDNKEYIKIDDYFGGQNSINLTPDKNYFLNLTISSNTIRSLKRTERPAIEFDLRFNKYYEGSLSDYLIETYGLSNGKIRYEILIGNEEDIYVIHKSPIMDLVNTYKFDKDTISANNFNNGTGWVPGINIVGSVEILNEDEEIILYILSNKLPFTKDLLRYFVKTDFTDEFDYIINNVNLDHIDMNILNINAVNKTENKIVTIERPLDNNSNISQTVFYRVTDFPSITIKPSVNENICINLDAYKHLVKSFILQVEGIKFIEIGRIKSGVIFKIVGSKLPKQVTSGQYYILNQDSELISSGKYNYEV